MLTSCFLARKRKSSSSSHHHHHHHHQPQNFGIVIIKHFFSRLSPLTPCRHAALHSPLRQPFRKPDDAVLLAWIIQVQSHAPSFVYRGNFHFSSCLQNATMHLRLKPLKSLATFRWQNICSESTEDNSCIQRRISIGYRHSPQQCLVYSIKTLELINCHILLPGESFINNKEIHYLSSPSN